MNSPGLTRKALAASSALFLGTVLPVSAQTPQTAPPPDDEVIVLSEFRVSPADAEGYQATSALSGTRFNIPLSELPKAIDVITEAFIEDIGALDMYDALRFTAGVESNSAPGIDDITGNNFVLRGISAQTTTYRNGYRSFGRTDPIMIQRIEVIRGPSSVFSGPIEPGGTINIITRRPNRRTSATLRGRYASYDRYRGEAILNTPLGSQKQAGVRVGISHEDYGSPYEFAGSRKTFIGAATDFRISKNSSLSFDFQYLKMFVRPAAPIPYLNSAVTNPTIDRFEPNVRREFNRQGPDAYSDNMQTQANIDFLHNFNETFSLHAGIYHRVQDLSRLLVGGSTRITESTVTGRRTAARTATYEPGAYSWAIAPQAYLLGNFQHDKFQNRAVIGAEYSRGKSRNDIFTRTLPGVNIDQFILSEYSLGDPSAYPVTELRRTEDRQLGLSFNNTTKFWDGRANLLYGFRYGEVRGTRERREIADPARRFTYANQNATAHSVGLSVRITRPLSVFASYSESFVPQSVISNTSFDKDGNQLPPISDKGWDIGVRYEINDGAVTATGIMFDITRKNAPTPDPDFPGFFIAEAQSVARGFEANLNGKLTRSLEIVSSYAYIQTKITDDSRPERIGWRSTNVPRHQVTAWLNYTFRSEQLRGWRASLGIIQKSNRRGNNTLADLPGIQLPGFVRYDGRISYNTRIWNRSTTFTLSSQNLTDKEYLFSANGYAEGRTIMGTVSITF